MRAVESRAVEKGLWRRQRGVGVRAVERRAVEGAVGKRVLYLILVAVTRERLERGSRVLLPALRLRGEIGHERRQRSLPRDQQLG